MRVLRVASFGIRFAIIGGGSMLASGLALADANVAIQTTDSDAVISIQSQTVEQEIVTQNSIVTDGVELPQAEATTPEASSPVLETANEPSVTSVDDQSAVAEVPVVADVAAAPALAAFPVRTGASFVAIYQPVSSLSMSSEGAVATSLPIEGASQPVGPPVQPIGAIGAFLTFFATVIPARTFDFIMSSSSALALLLVVTLLGLAYTLRRAEVSYGAWLKLGGFIAAGSTALPVPTSPFITSTSFGYACAPAPYA